MGYAALLETAGMVTSLLAVNDEAAQAQKQARENAKLADRAASDAIARGTHEAGLARMAGTQTIGAQKVAYVASGFDPSVGTPANVAAQTRAISEMDALTAENNAAREAWGFKTQARRIREGAQTELEGLTMKQVSTALGGAGRLAAHYDKSVEGKKRDDK